MPNRNYVKGVRLERELVNMYRNNKHYATRSAGSHSHFDVLAIVDDKLLLIQCKPKAERIPKLINRETLIVKQYVVHKEKGKLIFAEMV